MQVGFRDLTLWSFLMASAHGAGLMVLPFVLVLKALQLEPMHGWGITERIEQWSESVLQLGQGTLYPALYRLERQGLIQSEWKVTANNRAPATTR